jgi:enamine deaminase RidA (YjgF/YER057c/UK114 family)
MSIAERLNELGIKLPEPVKPAGSYIRWYQSGNQLYISGTGPSSDQPNGKLGADLTTEQGYQVARNVGLQILATVQAALGSLDRVQHVIKVLGMVNSTPDFDDQPGVINGCSDLFVEVLGDAGRHTRSAVGFVALPHNIPVEIEATFEVAAG